MDDLLIGDFEGPLDLLLHLIKKSKMEILDIEISDITNKYLKYIESMKELNLDIASEYLIMASELIEIKSKKLLPYTEDSNESDEENPENILKERLLEYQKYKQSTDIFRNLEENRSLYYTKMPEKLNLYTEQKLENDGSVTVYDLLDAFKKLLERQEFNKPLNTKITKKELSVRERIDKIRSILNIKKKINFIDLFDDFNKSYVVVTFLSILEMTKNKEIIIKQENNFSDIYLERVD